MPNSRTFDPTSRLGIVKVEDIVLNHFGWIPREIFQSDFGIDLEVELTDNKIPNGRLIACQIKTGSSYFSETKDDNVIYRGSLSHLKYWLNHSLPVILILHDPTKELTIWREINEHNIVRTVKAWYVEIPIDQIFSKESESQLRILNKQFPIYFQRLLRFSLDKKLMRLAKRRKLVIEISHWVNKSIGRVTIDINKIGKNEITLEAKKLIHYSGIEDLSAIFPWAEFELDESHHEEEDYENYMNEYGIYDGEEKRYVGARITYKEYADNLRSIRPIILGGGEVEFYRLLVNLNTLGRGYLEVDNFLEFGKQLPLQF